MMEKRREFQHTAARRRLATQHKADLALLAVSTHSRPKAAGLYQVLLSCFGGRCFNTQPPEGGWVALRYLETQGQGFNTQPPEGGWLHGMAAVDYTADVSTHSRPKAAGCKRCLLICRQNCFNTQPPEGGWDAFDELMLQHSGFNTQPPEGGWIRP